MSLHCLLISRRGDASRNLANQLRASGHVVLEIDDPREGADALRAPAFDFLVVDLSLPSLDLPSLQQALHRDTPAPPLSLEALERRHIGATLEYTGGNRRQAARLLGIARSTMLAKLRKYGLEGISREK